MASKTMKLSKKSLRPFFGFLLFAYFVLHLVQGERGYINLQKLEQKKRVVKAEYERLHVKRQTLEHRVVLLRGPELDRDLLDEQVRDKLGYADAGDAILVRRWDAHQE